MESSIDQGPYIVETGEDGLVAAAAPSEVETTRANAEEEEDSAQIGKTSYHLHKDNTRRGYNSLIGPLMNRVDQLSRDSRKSVWLLAYIAIISTWPLLGPALLLSIKKRFRRLIKN